MKRIDFSFDGDPVPGGSGEVIGAVTHDEPLPRLVPIRLNDSPLSLPVRNLLVKLQLQFVTGDRLTIAPGDGWEGNTLVLDVAEPA